MTTGFWLKKSILGLSLLWSIESFARNQMEAAHNPAILKFPSKVISIRGSNLPIDIFKATLYPFMQTNCSECHGDNAFYPVGPKHSVSDSKSAFEVFKKLLNPNDLQNSRFINIGKNKHYCKDHQYNCENQEQVTNELNRLFKSYVGAVSSSAESNTNPNLNTNQTGIYNSNPMALNQKSSKVDTSAFTIQPNEPTTHAVEIDVDNVALTLTTKVREFEPDFIKLVKISLSSDQKIDLTFEGIEIKINGHYPTKATGLETMQRDLSFDGLDRMNMTLTLNREVILNAKPGDQLTVKLLGLKQKELTSIVSSCENETFVEQVLEKASLYLPHISQVVYGNPNSYQKDASSKRSAKHICQQILLRINTDAPSRSILVQQLPKDMQMEVAQNIQKWLTLDTDTRVFEPVVLTANQYDIFCYALAKDVYCFGDSYSSNDPKHIPVPKGVKELRVGNGLVVIQDMENNWLFVGENVYSLPPNLTSLNSFVNEDKIIDIQLSYNFICYLNLKYELYCGGDEYDFIFYSSNSRIFNKLSNVKIKSFNLDSGKLKALDFDGKLYYFSVSPNDLGDTLNTILSYELNFNKKIESFQQYDDSLFVFTSDQNIYGFVEYLNGLSTLNPLFGEDFIQGKEISEGFKFSQIEFFYKGICGLTAEKDLFCRGRIPLGLKYENSESRESNKFTKISNAPKNIKKIFAGSSTICFILETNAITCAGSNGKNGIKQNITDNNGRLIHTGEIKPMSFEAPNIIAPIK